MYNFRKTGNTKIGAIPVTRSPQVNCPETCSLKGNGCYAESHWLGIHWKKDLTKGFMFSDLLSFVAKLKRNTLWRHNEAGDLSHVDGNINKDELFALVDANKGKRGFTYTHHIPNEHNAPLIKHSNDNGFTINVSAENMAMADEYFGLGIGPVVSILPIESEKVTMTPNGVRVVKCPNTYQDDLTCADCKLCHDADRNYIIGFPAHGSGKSKVNKIALTMI